MAFSIAALLSGCNGALNHAIPSGVNAQGIKKSVSWMKPGASSNQLLYVTDRARNLVHVFFFPSLKKAGTLKGFTVPFGECVDSSGDVWIVNQKPPEVRKYKHGGTKAIASLKVPGDIPYGCAIDPSSGNLAVTYANNSVAIYQGAEGTPVTYTDASFYRLKFCAYDGDGNLFFVGSGYGRAAELPKGSSSFTTIQFSQDVGSILAIQWMGSYFAIGGFQTKKVGGPEKVYQVQISGGYGTVDNIVDLEHKHESSAYAQFWIQGKSLIQPYGNRSRFLGVWNFPKGGLPVAGYKQDFKTDLFGTVVSPAYSPD